MLTQFAKPGAIVAVVSDSYDIFNAASKLWGEELKQKVVDSGATVVIRPDSGDPDIVCRKLVAILGEKFGYTTNAKGYKVLNNVRLIQGDGVNEHTIRMILGGFQAYGWSADNIAFGMGGALLQQVDRDTQKFAMKCSSITVNGEDREVFKDPITDEVKKSKKGRVQLWNSGGEWSSAVDQPKGWHDKGFGPFTPMLEEVYRDGKLVKEITFEQVRENSRK
jgi:nicotinamide phosphoribosyltransferase